MATSEYKATTVEGQKYNRAHTIIFFNPLDGMPSGEFQREDVIVIDGKKIKVPDKKVPIVFNPAKPIDIINPETGELTGSTVTMAELFAILYSLFVQEATVFDEDNPE